MDLENNYISLPFNWSGGVWAVTIVTLVVLAGTGFYLESLQWPRSMLWLKYLLTIILFNYRYCRSGLYANTIEGK